jgi:hypothetical protein
VNLKNADFQSILLSRERIISRKKIPARKKWKEDWKYFATEKMMDSPRKLALSGDWDWMRIY